MESDESDLVKRANELASSPYELICVESSDGTVYRRNTAWEWAGGNLYNKMGKVSSETLESGVLHENIRVRKDFGKQVRMDEISIEQAYLDFKGINE